MKVSNRILLTLLPSFVGLLTVVGLAYWGQYEHEAPHVAVLAAALALGLSVALAFRNARYIANAIERIVDITPGATGDELESIQRSVEEMKVAREEGKRREHDAHLERRELSTLLADAAASATRAVDEVRLPLHILLENRFGDLNENQEEIIGTAQASAEEASALLQRLRLVAELDREQVELRADPIRVDDVVRGLLPVMQTLGEARSVQVTTDIAPALPRVPADRTHLQEALSILLRSAVERTPDGSTVRVGIVGANGVVRLTMTHGAGTLPPLERALVERLARSMNIGFAESSDATTIEFATKR